MPDASSKHGYRAIFFEAEHNGLCIEGFYTAQDLRNLADWLDDPNHPTVKPGWPLIKVELSPLKR